MQLYLLLDGIQIFPPISWKVAIAIATRDITEIQFDEVAQSFAQGYRGICYSGNVHVIVLTLLKMNDGTNTSGASQAMNINLTQSAYIISALNFHQK